MKDKTKRIAVGAAIAGAVGYIAGILTAPKSGKDTRKDIQVAATKAKNEAEKQLKELHSELDQLLAKAKQQSTKLQGASKQGIDKAVAVAQTAKAKAREVLSLAHEGGTDDTDLQKVVRDVSKAVEDLKTYLSKNETNSK
jgi:gas vesicle protein